MVSIEEAKLAVKLHCYSDLFYERKPNIKPVVLINAVWVRLDETGKTEFDDIEIFNILSEETRRLERRDG